MSQLLFSGLEEVVSLQFVEVSVLGGAGWLPEEVAWHGVSQGDTAHGRQVTAR